MTAFETAALRSGIMRVATNGDGNVSVVGDELMRRVKSAPAGIWDQRFHPGMTGLLALNRLIRREPRIQVAHHVTGGNAPMPEQTDQRMCKILTHAFC